MAEKPITQPQILFQNNFLLSPHLSDQTMHFSSIPCLTDFLSLQDPNLLPLICEFYLNPQCFILGKLFAQLCPTLVTPQTVAHQAPLLCPWDFPGKNTGVDCCFVLQGSFLTQGSNLGLPHCRQILYHLSHQESPFFFHPGVVQLMVTQLCPGLETLEHVFCVPLISSKAVTHRVWCCLQSPSHLHSASASW